jgi:voltage-gated potassium channel
MDVSMTSNTKATEAKRPAELQAPGYEIFIGILSIISLINLAISVLPWFSPAVVSIARDIDIPITLIFLVDFTSRLLRSHPRRAYFVEQKGYLDLLGSLPAGFKLFRIFRVVRVGRLLREYGARNVFKSFVAHRADNALLVVMLLVLVVLEFGSMAVVSFEQYAEGANIVTGGDALWWAFVSITTVGYGDKFPITSGGRISAFFVLAAGVGLFGVLSGYLANFFLSPATTDDDEAAAEAAAGTATAAATTAQATAIDRDEVLATLDELQAGIDGLRRKLG